MHHFCVLLSPFWPDYDTIYKCREPRISETFDGLPCGPAQARQTVGDHRRHRQGARAQGGGPQRHRAGRRRAGFRHARQHQGGGDQGDPRRQGVQVHQCGRHRRAEGRRRQEVQARERPRLQASQITVGTGGKQVLYNAFICDAQSGRRGDLRRALLGELFRHGAARRRRAGGGRDLDGGRLQADRGAARARDHAEDQMGAAQLAVEPVGRRLYARRAEGAHRRAGEAPACARDDRRHV